MPKATTNDIGAICSRIDAQTVIMIELACDGDAHKSAKYRKKYDRMAEEFRKGIVDF